MFVMRIIHLTSADIIQWLSTIFKYLLLLLLLFILCSIVFEFKNCTWAGQFKPNYYSILITSVIYIFLEYLL